MAGQVIGAVAGSVLSSALAPKGGQTSTQSTQRTMPDWLSTDWQDLITQAQTTSNSPFQAYTGQSTAPLSGDENSAFDIIRQMQGQANPIFGQSQNTLQDVLSRAQNGPSASDVHSLMNPYTQNVLDQQNLLTLQDYDRTQQGIKSSATMQGAFGGSGQYIQQAMAHKNLGQQLASNNATGLANAYNQAMSQYNLNTGTMGQTAIGQANLASQLQGITGNNASMLANAGATSRGIEQSQDTFNYNEFMRQQQDPQQKASFLSNIMAQGSPQYTGTTSQITQPSPNSLNSIVGGGIAGSQLGGALGNAYQGSNLQNGMNSLFSGNGFSNGWGLNSSISGMMSANPSIFKEGGLVKKYAEGGLVKGYDSGGLIYGLANNPESVTNSSKLFPGLASLYKYLEPALNPASITQDPNEDPVAAHNNAVQKQELLTGNSQAQRPDLRNPMAANSSLPPSLSYTPDPLNDMLTGVNADNVPDIGEDIPVAPTGMGTTDTSSVLDKLINQAISDKATEANKPKSFMDDANTPLLAMGLAMMGSNDPNFGGALSEGYKAFGQLSKQQDEEKDKKLNDLLSLAANQRRMKSSAIEDELKQAQTKYYGNKATGTGAGGLTKNQQLVHLDKLRAQGKASIDAQVKMGQLSPQQERTARSANEKNAQERYKSDMEALGVTPLVGANVAQGSSQDNPVSITTRAELETLPSGTWVLLPGQTTPTKRK